MTPPAKFLHVGGVLLKDEVSYNAGSPTLAAATDGFLIHLEDRASLPVAEIRYLHDGSRGLNPGNLGIARRNQQRGRNMTISLAAVSRGGGAAYSATVLPSLHRLLKAAGFDAAIVTTPGTEKVTYTPTAPDTIGASLAGEFYARKEKFRAQGILANWSWEFSDGAPPVHTFPLVGTMPDDVADAALPVITYPEETIEPSPGALAALTLGNLTAANARILTASFAWNREFDRQRGTDSAGKHQGFIPGGRTPELTIQLEATALTGTPFTTAGAFDGYKLAELGTDLAVALAFGSTPYFREKYSFAAAQVTSATPSEHNGVATMTLVLAPVAGVMSVVFD